MVRCSEHSAPDTCSSTGKLVLITTGHIFITTSRQKIDKLWTITVLVIGLGAGSAKNAESDAPVNGLPASLAQSEANNANMD